MCKFFTEIIKIQNTTAASTTKSKKSLRYLIQQTVKQGTAWKVANFDSFPSGKENKLKMNIEGC